VVVVVVVVPEGLQGVLGTGTDGGYAGAEGNTLEELVEGDDDEEGDEEAVARDDQGQADD
jgi:hypothetical protein